MMGWGEEKTSKVGWPAPAVKLLQMVDVFLRGGASRDELQAAWREASRMRHWDGHE